MINQTRPKVRGREGVATMGGSMARIDPLITPAAETAADDDLQAMSVDFFVSFVQVFGPPQFDRPNLRAAGCL
jgi:hypothetical protein